MELFAGEELVNARNPNQITIFSLGAPTGTL